MKTKAELQVELRKANNAFFTLRRALITARYEAHSASNKGNSINPGWLVQHTTEALTTADIEKSS